MGEVVVVCCCFVSSDWLTSCPCSLNLCFAFFVGESFVGGSQCGEHGDDGVRLCRGKLVGMCMLSLETWLAFTHLTKSSQVLYHFIFCLSLLIKKFLIVLVFLSCVYIGFDMPFDSLWLDFHPCLYIYIYRFFFYLLEVGTSNQGCAHILFFQKYLSITNKSIIYYLH